MNKYMYMEEVDSLMVELRRITSPNSWKKSYSYRIKRFFEEYLSKEEHRKRKLSEITAHDINYFIANLPLKHNEKVNYYRVLKVFFDFTSKKGVTVPFYINVTKLTQEKKLPIYINEDDFKRLVQFIHSDLKIEHRLMLGLFLYTGLSRKYISELSFSQIKDDLTSFRFDSGETQIPIKSELTKILIEYKSFCNKKYSERFFNINENTISTEVKYISKHACGHGYNPTDFSNTFIKKCLGEEKWKNLYTVSKLTMESLSTIEKHIKDIPPWLVDEQRIILCKWD